MASSFRDRCASLLPGPTLLLRERTHPTADNPEELEACILSPSRRSPRAQTVPRLPVGPAGHLGESVEFVWNLRKCTGTRFHKAALEGDAEIVSAILKEEPRVLTSRFRYETVHQGKVQEGSGEALHLAASRAHKAVVERLLRAGARLDASVTRDHQPHYDVLHAAVFAEGRRDNEDMVRYLLAERAPLTQNLNGHWPLHKAFQIGATNLLPLLRREAERQGVLQEMLESEPTPLELGIQGGHLSEDQLARAAAPTLGSLRSFMDHEPRCIPYFLDRMVTMHGRDLAKVLSRELRRRDNIIRQRSSRSPSPAGRSCERVTAAELATHVHGSDLAKVLREYPPAACALLDGMTAEPDCANKGWHPLPTRVSFAARNWQDRLRDVVNPGTRMLSFYQPDTVWRYNVTTFESPEWHKDLAGREWGGPFLDADIRVCHVPNLVCAEFFSALVDAADNDTLHIFEHPVIRGVIRHAWWNGACRLDLLHVGLSIWGLAILVTESVFGLEMSTSVSTDFIGAKAIVDFGYGILRMATTMSMAHWSRQVSRTNLWDLFRCVVPMALLYDPGSKTVQVLVIFIYWWQLLGVFTFAESIASALLPILNLTRGLLPAAGVTAVGFCAFTHAFHCVRGGGAATWNETFFRSFATLFTAQLPPHPRPDELLLCYTAVSFFSVFFLNIFIGVIGQQYQEERKRVPLTFQLVRAAKCLAYFTQSRCLPCTLVSRRVANGGCFLVASGAFGLQVRGILKGGPLPWTRPALVLCQVAFLLSAHQDPNAPWAKRKKAGEQGHYLWLALPRKTMVPNVLEHWQKHQVCGRCASDIEDVRTLRDSNSGPSNMSGHTPSLRS